MLSVKINAKGLAKGLDIARDAFLDGMEAGLTEAALTIEKAAKEKTPKETGELRQSIQSEFKPLGFGVAKVRVYTNNQYAIYVHEGTGIYARHGDGRKDVPWTYQDDETGLYLRTSGMHATPFMEDAVTECKDLVNQIVREEIERRLGG